MYNDKLDSKIIHSTCIEVHCLQLYNYYVHES